MTPFLSLSGDSHKHELKRVKKFLVTDAEKLYWKTYIWVEEETVPESKQKQISSQQP